MRLIADHISHAYDALPVLDDISFEVGPGEVVAVVGPSGCGKSTLLRILGGIEQPRAGRALLSGAVGESLNPLTFVFQDFALLPWRTVRDNIRLPLESHGLASDSMAAVIADVLKRTKLLDFADAYPKQLSGGMKQRVGIARALAVKPAVLLMDEPLSALDGQTRELLMDDLVQLHAGGHLASVYVTHNLDEAVRLADRVVVLRRRPGRIAAILDLPVPRAERHAGDPALTAESRKLWELIRADAEAADREMQDA